MSRRILGSLSLLGTLVFVGRTMYLGASTSSPTEDRINEESSMVRRTVAQPRKLEGAKTFDIEVKIKYDNYAEDTSWNLTDSKGNLVASNSASADDDLKEESVVTAVPAGTYTLEVFDSYYDGLCCKLSESDGYYQLIVDGKTLAIGGEFADTTGPIVIKIYSNGVVKLGDETVLGLQPYCLDDRPDEFDICLYLSTKTGHFRNDWLKAFDTAKKKWETIIVGDEHKSVKFDHGPRVWQRPVALDDIYISGSAAYIDGPYKVLGASGPRTTIVTNRTNPLTKKHFEQSLTGEMVFDSADITRMMKEGTYEDVIVHEMGHVLGIGTMWPNNGLHSGNMSDPVYNGVNAQREFHDYGFPGKLEVEIHHGPGTAGGHWDEECLRTEIMTGIADDEMQFSRVTIGGMEDLGYAVDYSAADAYKVSEDANCGPQDPDNEDARVRQLVGKHTRRRKLSDRGREEAVKYGEALIAKTFEKKEKYVLAKGEKFLEHQVRHVLYEEKGNLYSVQVHGTNSLSSSSDKKR